MSSAKEIKQVTSDDGFNGAQQNISMNNYYTVDDTTDDVSNSMIADTNVITHSTETNDPVSNRLCSESENENQIFLQGLNPPENSLIESYSDVTRRHKFTVPLDSSGMSGNANNSLSDFSDMEASNSDSVKAPHSTNAIDNEEVEFSSRILRQNMNRLAKGLQPIWPLFAAVKNVFTYQNPANTAIIAVIYFTAVLTGLLLPLVALLIIIKLIVSYLIANGHLDPYCADNSKKPATAPKGNLVVIVVTQAQEKSGKLADALEKIKNVITWRAPQFTITVLAIATILFIASLILELCFLCQVAGLFLGVKFFFIEPIFYFWPELRLKYDSVYCAWLQIPTDYDFEIQQMNKDFQKYVIPLSEEEEKLRPVSIEIDKKFTSIFDLPNKEQPLPQWRSGKKCALLLDNEDPTKTLTETMKRGKIYITRSFFCFKRGSDKSRARRNLVIPLMMIQSVKKKGPIKSLSPGLEVKVYGVPMPLVFAMILAGKDDLYDCMMEEGKKAMLPWATGIPYTETPKVDHSLVKAVQNAMVFIPPDKED